MKRIGGLLIEMATNVARIEREMAQTRRAVGNTMKGVQKSADLARRAMVGFVGALSVRELARASDQFKDINASLKIATRSAEAGAKAYRDVYKIAMQTGQAIQGVGNTYRRFAEVSDQLGVSQRQITSAVKTVSQAMTISGGSAESARAALLQFSQGLAAGALRGQELNSVMEQAPRLSRLIADGMAIPIGSLRDFAKEGKVTSQVILQALESQAQAIEEEYSQIPLTVARASTNLNTAFVNMIGNADKTVGVFDLLAKAINTLANNLTTAAEIIGMVALVLTGRLVGAFTATIATANGATIAVRTLNGALSLLGGKAGLLFTAASALTYFAYKAFDAKNATLDLQEAIAQLSEDLIGLSRQEKLDWLQGLGIQSKLTSDRIAVINAELKRLENGITTRKTVLEVTELRKELKDLKTDSKEVNASIEAIMRNITRDTFVPSITPIIETTESIEDLEDKYRDLIRAYTDETDMLSMTRAERELFIFQNKLISDGVGALTIQYKHLTDAKRAAIQQRIAKEDELEAIDKQAEALEKFKNKADSINEQIGQSLTDALMNGTKSAGDFMKDFFKTLVLRPILQPLITGVTGALGLGAAGASMAGGLPGFGMGDVAGGGTDIFGLLKTAQSAYSAVTNGFASIGATAGSMAAQATAAAKYGVSIFSEQAAMLAAQEIGMATTVGNAAATVGAAATVIAGVAAGVTAGTMISGKYKLGGDQMISTGLGTAAGTAIGFAVGGPVGAAVGALIGGAGGGLLNRAFGKGPKETQATGITGTIGFNGANISNYRDWSRSGGWFSSGSSGTDITAADPMLVSYLNNQLNTIGGSIGVLAETLGYSSERIGRYTENIKLNLKGMSGQQAQDTISDRLKQFGNNLTNYVAPAVRFMTQAGESSSEALSRLAKSLTTVNQNFDTLGIALLDVSLNSAQAASDLIAMTGGVEEFQRKSNFIFNSFYTEQQRITKLTEEAALVFAELGVAMPMTRDGFRQIFEVVAGSGSASLTAALMNLAPAMNEVITYTEKLTEANGELLGVIIQEMMTLDNKALQLLGDSATLRERELSAINGSNLALATSIMDYEAAQTAMSEAASATDAALVQLESALRDRLVQTLNTLQIEFESLTASINEQINAQQISAQVAGENLIGLQSIFGLLNREINSILGGSAMSAAEGRAFISNAVANAQNTGYLPEQDALSQAIRAARSGLGSENFATSTDQRRAEALLAIELQKLADVSETQLTDAERAITLAEEQLLALYAQLDQASQQYIADQAAAEADFNERLTQAQDQINVLRDIDDSVFGVNQSVQMLAAAINEERAAMITLQQQMINLQQERNAREAAERARIEAEKRAEAERKAEAERQRIEAERRAAERAAEERRRAEAERQARARAAAEAAARRAAEEEARKAAEEARSRQMLSFLVGGTVLGNMMGVENPYRSSVGSGSYMDSQGNIHADQFGQNADGGHWQGGLSLVGEEGPELVNFARPSMIYTANETRDILSKGGSDNEDVKTELKHIREENQANQQAIVSLQYRMFKIFQRWDGEGLPDERTVSV